MIKQYTREDILEKIIKMGLRPAMYAYNRADFISQIWLLLDFAGFDMKNGIDSLDYKLRNNKDIKYNINTDGNIRIDALSPNDDWAQKVVNLVKKEYFDLNV